VGLLGRLQVQIFQTFSAICLLDIEDFLTSVMFKNCRKNSITIICNQFEQNLKDLKYTEEKGL